MSIVTKEDVQLSARTRSQRIADDFGMFVLPVFWACSVLLCFSVAAISVAASLVIEGVPLIQESSREWVNFLTPLSWILFAVFSLGYLWWLRQYRLRLYAYGIEVKAPTFSNRGPLRFAEVRGVVPKAVPVYSRFFRW